MTNEAGRSPELVPPAGGPVRRLTGRPPMPDLQGRIAAALDDPFLQRVLPVALDSMCFRRNEAVAAMGVDAFEALRERGRAIRRHTIQHLDHYLDRLKKRVEERGGRVFFAKTAEDAVRYVAEVAQARGVRTAI